MGLSLLAFPDTCGTPFRGRGRRRRGGIWHSFGGCDTVAFGLRQFCSFWFRVQKQTREGTNVVNHGFQALIMIPAIEATLACRFILSKGSR